MEEREQTLFKERKQRSAAFFRSPFDIVLHRTYVGHEKSPFSHGEHGCVSSAPSKEGDITDGGTLIDIGARCKFVACLLHSSPC